MPARAMLVRCTLYAAPLSLLLVALPGQADDASQLLTAINVYRDQPQRCAGERHAAAGPLSPSEALAGVTLRAGQPLGQALQAAGYSAASSQALVVQGPRSARAAMKALTERYCEALLDPSFAQAGVRREGTQWQVVLAQPLLASGLGNWEEAGRAVLAAVNQARAEQRVCGTRRYDAVPPLDWSPALAEAALGHSQDMARRNYFAHQAPDGSGPGERARRAGFDWQWIGENIAAGQGSVDQVVAGWLNSPRHCANIMSPGFTRMGAAYALNEASDARIYWTQVFGSPQR